MALAAATAIFSHKLFNITAYFYHSCMLKNMALNVSKVAVAAVSVIFPLSLFFVFDENVEKQHK